MQNETVALFFAQQSHSTIFFSVCLPTIDYSFARNFKETNFPLSAYYPNKRILFYFN
ncbi:hypothetical protein JCM6292_2889 [Bacteroides pyogenes JCM 6292]|uniref:Uncharacterized protein n=1 Tax=Bacteroides pyogenes JCM 6292 TaxID=1235809 RepID=W4P9J3_9BACE|nr:hypothetical protein JCM6292_2889 [Bacteroides pyogenes JCM 6292]